MKKKYLIYFDSNLTQSFGLTDIEKLSEGFDHTLLFSENAVENKKDFSPSIGFEENYLNWDNYKPMKTLLVNLFLILEILFIERRAHGFNPSQMMRLVKKSSSNIFKAESIMAKLKALKVDTHDMVFYSFWFYDCIFQAILKRKFKSAFSIIRTHGGDLYEDSSTLQGQILARNFQLKYTDWCVSISQLGAKYLQQLYPASQQKIFCSRLGTDTPIGPNPHDANRIVLVSCSHVRNVKRVHLIAEALCLVDVEIAWYHFGDIGHPDSRDPYIGYFHDAIEKLKSNRKVEAHIMGNLSVQKIYKFYEKNAVSALVSTSSTEGIPVSMMEAISFGIPVIGTDVGACAEIITAKTGILIPEDLSPSYLAKIFSDFSGSDLNTTVFRTGVKEFWEQNFNCNHNYKLLLDRLQQVYLN